MLLRGSPDPANENGRVQRRERLGGLLNFYHRTAVDQILRQDGGLVVLLDGLDVSARARSSCPSIWVRLWRRDSVN